MLFVENNAQKYTKNHNLFAGAPAKTVGWRDPGYFHTSFLSGLSSNSLYATRFYSM